MPTMYSSPRAQCAISATRFDCVPLGRNRPASKPRSRASRACSALTVGSSPSTSSPTSSAAIAARIAASGRVTVSLRRSIQSGLVPAMPHGNAAARGPHFGPMKIASWNVNSLNVRLPHLEQWLAEARPDVVGLQETKLEDLKFPDAVLAGHGYRSVFSGQKTYNGVA